MTDNEIIKALEDCFDKNEIVVSIYEPNDTKTDVTIQDVLDLINRQKERESMVKVYGCSDDLVEIENSTYKEDEIGCYDSDVRIRFLDGTVIRVGYSKPNLAVWWIEVEKQGTANQMLTICEDEEADIYSDIFVIDSEIKSHGVIKKKEREKE